MTEIEKLYEVIQWPMRPEDPKARVRFANLVELFTFLLANHPFFEFLRGREHVRVLDVMAVSGIAGAALAKALTLRKLRVSLTVSDVRQSDLQLVHKWLEEVKGVEVETVAAGSLKYTKSCQTGRNIMT